MRRVNCTQKKVWAFVFIQYVSLWQYDIYLCMVCKERTMFGWDTTIWKSGILGCKKIKNIEKITFIVVQMKFLAMHLTYQKFSFDKFTVGNLLNIFIEHGLYLISYWFLAFDPYNVLLAIATNIPMLLMTGFVLQDHKWIIALYILNILVYL